MSKKKKWDFSRKFFESSMIKIFLNFIIPIIFFCLGASASLLPQTYKDRFKFEEMVFIVLLVGSVLFSVLILFYLGAIIFKKLESQVARYEEINDNVEDLAKAKAVQVEFASQIINDNLKDAAERIRNYFTTTTQFIDKAEKSIIIFDYLEYHNTFNKIVDNLLSKNGKQEKEIKEDEKLHKAINESCTKHYNSIVSHFGEEIDLRRDNKLKYTRILMLPLSCPSIINSEQQFDNSIKLRDCINNITLKHIETLFNKKREFQGRIHFKIMPFPISNFSFGIIDSKKLLLELDTFNIIGKPLPNHLFIIHDDENGDIVQPFKNHFYTHFSKAVDIEDLEVLDQTVGDFMTEMVRRRKRKIEKSLKNYA